MVLTEISEFEKTSTNKSGISNVYNGTYMDASGTKTGETTLSPKALLAVKDATLSATLATKIEAALALAQEINDNAPFDKLIDTTAGKAKVNACVAALKEVKETVQTAATTLGIDIGNIDTL